MKLFARLYRLAAIAVLVALVAWPAYANSPTKVGQFVGTPIFPGGLTGTVDDWAPAGLSDATIIFATTSGTTTLDGLTGGVSGRFIYLCNESASALTIVSEATGSAPANRFTLPNGSAVTLGASGNQCASFNYDGSVSRWKAYSSTSSLAETILSPPAITGTVNDWSPSGWTGGTTASTLIEVSLSNTTALNGLVAQNVGSTVTLCNMSATFNLTIQDEAAGSAPGNRFENQGGLITLNHHAGPEPECANYYYSGSQSRWISLATTASTIHALTVTSGFNVASSGATINGGLSVAAAYSGIAAGTSTMSSASTGTADTTAGAVQLNGINCTNALTRSAGANNLTNVCGQFDASGGQVNDAILTLRGNNIFNQTSGTSTFDGNLIMGTAGAVIQLIQASGASSSPKLTAFSGNPNGTVAGTAGDLLLDTSTPAVWQSTGGTAWSEAGTGVTGSGIAGNLMEWATSTSAGSAPITDNGAGALATTDTLSTGALASTAVTDSGALLLTGKTSDASTGTVNNFNIPTGAGGTSVLRSAPGSAVTYTGFQCGGSTCTSANDGMVLILYDAGATGVTLTSEGASSTAGNRIWVQNNAPLTLSGNASNPNTGAVLVYDGTSTRWRVISTNQVIWTAAVTMSSTLATANGITVSGSRLNLSTGAARVADTATGPTLTSCGGSPATTTGEGKFTITVGSTATGCVATFATAFTGTPTCTVTAQNGTPVVYSTSSAAVTISTGIVSGAKYDIDCNDH